MNTRITTIMTTVTTVIKALIFYAMIILYAFMYNILAECSLYAEKIFFNKFDFFGDKLQLYKKYTLYHNLEYMYSHTFLVIFKICKFVDNLPTH